MPRTEKWNLLQAMSFIHKEARKSQLSESVFERLQPELEALGAHFQITNTQAFFLAQIFISNCNDSDAEISDLSSHFDCEPFRVMEYYGDLTTLYEKGLIHKSRSRNRLVTLITDQYVVDEEICKAILLNLPADAIKVSAPEELLSILEKVMLAAGERAQNRNSPEELFENMNRLIKRNKQSSFLQKLSGFDPADTFVMLYLSWQTAMGKCRIEPEIITDWIFDNPVKRNYYLHSFQSRENALIKTGWIECVTASVADESMIQLTAIGMQALRDENIPLLSPRTPKGIFKAKECVPEKTLFFNPNETKQVKTLERILHEENFLRMQQRLTQRHLSGGLTVLLHGAPGTGKTESVLQLARQSGRELFRVEISESKSKWYGESEKIFKRIFTKYAAFAQQCERCPILFFNEADALFSRRRNIVDTSTDQTDNTLQNILLEELENFKGILFATNNLAAHLDPAFERRFLFKVRFNAPDETVRYEIWRSKLSAATEETCKILARRYELSGAQIENVVRKCEMSEILNGTFPTLEEILTFCAEEQLQQEPRPSIGFTTKASETVLELKGF